MPLLNLLLSSHSVPAPAPPVLQGNLRKVNADARSDCEGDENGDDPGELYDPPCTDCAKAKHPCERSSGLSKACVACNHHKHSCDYVNQGTKQHRHEEDPTPPKVAGRQRVKRTGHGQERKKSKVKAKATPPVELSDDEEEVQEVERNDKARMGKQVWVQGITLSSAKTCMPVPTSSCHH